MNTRKYDFSPLAEPAGEITHAGAGKTASDRREDCRKWRQAAQQHAWRRHWRIAANIVRVPGGGVTLFIRRLV